MANIKLGKFGREKTQNERNGKEKRLFAYFWTFLDQKNQYSFIPKPSHSEGQELFKKMSFVENIT